MRKLAIAILFFLGTAVIAQPPLPQSIIDQWADPSVTSITMPQGKYTITKNLPGIGRSGVTINGAGCTLVLDPAKDWFGKSDLYPIRIFSTPVDNVFNTSPGGNAKRTVSKLTGTITASTTQLKMAEVVDLQPGEIVLIYAGANKSDPVEPYTYIVATVATADPASGIVTFTKALGVAVPSYSSLEGFKAVVQQDLRWKVKEWGEWPSEANWSKGYGLDHGLGRFVGGMTSNVTINDLTLELVPAVSAATMPNGEWLISTSSVNGFTLNGLNIVNPWGMCVHQMRSFNSNISRVNISGKGLCKIDNSRTMNAIAFTAWGGDSMNFSDVDISASDTTVFNFEVNPGKTTLNRLNYKSEFTGARDYPSSPGILGFYNVLDVPRITDATIDATWVAGSKPEWYSYSPILFDGATKFPSLLTPLDFGYQRKPSFDGTVEIAGTVYGPLQRAYTTYTVPYGSFYKLVLPQGVSLPGCRFRVLSKGDLRDVTDSFGNRYRFKTNDWQPLAPNHWHQVASQAYFGRYMMFWFEPGSKAASVEFDYTHLPKR